MAGESVPGAEGGEQNDGQPLANGNSENGGAHTGKKLTANEKRRLRAKTKQAEKKSER